MSAVLPVMDQITEAIIDRLRGSASAVEVVALESLPTFSPQDLQVIVTPMDAESNGDWGFQASTPVRAFSRPYVVTCFRRQSEDDPRAVDVLLGEFSAAVFSTITSPADWQTWGGKAVDTQVGSVEKWNDAESGLAAHRIFLNVIYRHSETDPYTPR